MAESAISFLVNQLSSWLQQEAQLLGGLRDEVEWVRNEMGQMRAFLRIAEAKEDANPILSEWVRQVREIAYDTEDTIEEFMLRFGRESGRGFIGSMKKIYHSLKHLKARHRLGTDIQKIRSRIDDVSQSKQRFRDVYDLMLQGGSSSTTYVGNTLYDGRSNALLLEEAEVVGIEKPKKQLLEWLSSRNGGLKVISVVGMPGLGKTTLVKKVYDDASVNSTFDYHVWITVSESFNINHLLKDMIKQLVTKVKQPLPQGLEAMNDDAAREFIYNFLQNKSYMIVLDDDIWKVEAWEALKYAFPRSNTFGQGYIIITTRFNNIGNVACTETNGNFYSLEPLSDEASEELFNRKAFPENKQCPSYLKEISKKILRRCEGLPLAIVVISGLLATKNKRIDEWEMFSRGLGSELVEGDNLKRMKNLIALSYYDLPYYLKACFIYLSIFSEDELITKWMLLRMWIGEGFVEEKEGKTKTEVADGYLNELLNRSLIQVKETFTDGTPGKLHVHDLIREYIIKKARDENFVTVDNHGERRWPGKMRRLAIHGPINHHLNSHYLQDDDSKFKSLRSLIIFGSSSTDDDVSGSILYKILGSGCRMLKVLKLTGGSLDMVPDEVYKLYHLEYLDLQDTRVHHISKLIGNLGKLETLDLRGSMVYELPIKILELRRLCNILVCKFKDYLHGYSQFDYEESFKAPYEIGKLSCLQKLAYIEAGCGAGGIRIVKEVGKLTQLRELGITKLRREDGKELSSSLAKLTNLRWLYIFSAEEDEVIDLQYNNTALPFLDSLSLSGRLECMPSWISSLKNLTELHLRWSRLRENPLECLQGLPNLVNLVMNSAYEGEGLCFKEGGGFPKLKKLFLTRLSCLRWVRVGKGSMPHLEKLIIENCRMMKEVPTGIEHLTNLSLVEFDDMSDEFLKRLSDEKRSEQLWKKNEPSPQVVIRAFNWVEEGENSGWEEWEL